MPEAIIVISFEKPVGSNFLDESNYTVVREDDSHLYIQVETSCRYKGDDETVVHALYAWFLADYSGNYSIVWDESVF